MSQMSPLAPEQKSRLPDYCASSVFVKILMLRGYSFDETSFSRISFQKKVRTHHKKGYPLNTQLTKWSCSNHASDPPGRGHLGGLGPGLHAQFEQFAAGRESGAEEGPDSRSLGNAHLSLCPPARSSPSLHLTQSSWRKEERRQWKQHLDTATTHSQKIVRQSYVFACVCSVLQNIGSEITVWLWGWRAEFELYLRVNKCKQCMNCFSFYT